MNEPNYKAIVGWMERFICGYNSIELIEEDGGVIVICRSHRVQNCYAGATAHEALFNAMEGEK